MAHHPWTPPSPPPSLLLLFLLLLFLCHGFHAAVAGASTLHTVPRKAGSRAVNLAGYAPARDNAADVIGSTGSELGFGSSGAVWRNATEPLQERLDDLLPQLTLDDLVAQLGGPGEHKGTSGCALCTSALRLIIRIDNCDQPYMYQVWATSFGRT